MVRWIAAFLSFVMWLTSSHCNAEKVTVAVASNFLPPMKKIQSQFEASSEHTLSVSFGSSGKLTSQIQQGAPFDVLLSADQKKPDFLVKNHLAIAETQFTYAQGALVLWSKAPNLVDTEGQVLKSNRFKRIAMANPRLAPYGIAAQDVLKGLGVYGALKTKIVRGENIAQTYQFIATGNAELGFIAKSQLAQLMVKTSQTSQLGSYWDIPPALYTPIRQDAILLNKGRDNPGARAFLNYLRSEPARVIIQTYGYSVNQ